MILLIIAFIVVFLVGMGWGAGLLTMIKALKKRRARNIREYKRSHIMSGYPGAPPPLKSYLRTSQTEEVK